MFPFIEQDHEDYQEEYHPTETIVQDIWGTKNPQAIHTSQQTTTAILNQQELVKLQSGKVMIESEFKLFDSIMKSIPQTRISLAPIVSQPVSQPITQSSQTNTQVNSIEFQLNQKGIILLALIFAGCLLSTIALIKVWGTTDIAQQQAYQERIDSQYNEIGKRYDKLAKASENLAVKLGKKSDVCVSFYCGKDSSGNREDNQETTQPASTQKSSHINYGETGFQQPVINNLDYYNALIEVSRWKRDGQSKSRALAFSNWIQKNPRVAKTEGYPSYPAISKAVTEVYSN